MNRLLGNLEPAFSSMRLNPLRTILSTLGIVMGAGALVSVLTMSDGVETFVRDQIQQTTDLQSIQITPLTSRTVDGQTIPIASPVSIASGQIDELAGRLQSVATVARFYRAPALLGESGSGAVALAGVSRLPDSLPPLADGRYPTEAELSRNEPLVVIGESLARRTELSAGDTIVLGGSHLTIAGVWRDDQPGDVVMLPLELAQDVTAGPRQPATVLVRVKRVEDVSAAADTVTAWLEETYPSRAEEVRVSVAAARLRQARQGIQIFRLLMGAMTGVALVVGGVGIMNVLLASVAERTREIGIRKSVGARRRDILGQFLMESLVISSLGCLAGVLLGWGVAFVVALLMKSQTGAPISPALTPTTVVVAVVVAASVGLAFGSYPALRAARLSPIDALRHE